MRLVDASLSTSPAEVPLLLLLLLPSDFFIGALGTADFSLCVKVTLPQPGDGFLAYLRGVEKPDQDAAVASSSSSSSPSSSLLLCHAEHSK